MKITRSKTIIGVILFIGLFLIGWLLWRNGSVTIPPQEDGLAATDALSPTGETAIKPPVTVTNPSIKGKPVTLTKDKDQVLLFQAAGLSLPIVFGGSEGNEVSPKLQQTIAADLQLIYAHLDTVEVLPFEPRTFSVRGRYLAASKRIQLTGEGRFRPSAHHNQFGWIVQIEGVEHLVIPEELIKAYRQADKLRASHRSAARKLDEFSAELESSNPQRFAGMKPEDVIWSPEPEEVWRGFYAKLQTMRFRRPSFLDFFVNDKENNPSGKSDFPAGAVVANALTLNEKGIPTGYWPLVYLRGKWRVAGLTMGG